MLSRQWLDFRRVHGSWVWWPKHPGIGVQAGKNLFCTSKCVTKQNDLLRKPRAISVHFPHRRPTQTHFFKNRHSLSWTLKFLSVASVPRLFGSCRTPTCITLIGRVLKTKKYSRPHESFHFGTLVFCCYQIQFARRESPATEALVVRKKFQAVQILTNRSTFVFTTHRPRVVLSVLLWVFCAFRHRRKVGFSLIYESSLLPLNVVLLSSFVSKMPRDHWRDLRSKKLALCVYVLCFGCSC